MVTLVSQRTGGCGPHTRDTPPSRRTMCPPCMDPQAATPKATKSCPLSLSQTRAPPQKNLMWFCCSVQRVTTSATSGGAVAMVWSDSALGRTQLLRIARGTWRVSQCRRSCECVAWRNTQVDEVSSYCRYADCTYCNNFFFDFVTAIHIIMSCSL